MEGKLTISSDETTAEQLATMDEVSRASTIPMHCLDFTGPVPGDYGAHIAAIYVFLGEEAALRLAACWNACACVGTGALASLSRKYDGNILNNMLSELHGLNVQRDELLAALRSIKQEIFYGIKDGAADRIDAIATPAIAKAKGISPPFITAAEFDALPTAGPTIAELQEAGTLPKVDLLAQRNELLAALEEIADLPEARQDESYLLARDAIAKVEGGVQ